MQDSTMEEVETSDSDSEESDCLIVELEPNEEKDESKPSSNESTCEAEPAVNDPVLSLECLREESSNEENKQSDSKSQFIDPDDIQDLTICIDEEKRHSDLGVLLEKSPSIVSCVSLSKPQSAIPARSDWHGAHNFKIKIDNGDAMKKSECSVFFEEQNKLYVSKDYPFKVLVSAENVPAGSVIKAAAIFSRVEHTYESVQRCPTHAQQDFVKGLATFEHLVQCFSDNSLYEKDFNTGTLSVSVPYEKPKENPIKKDLYLAMRKSALLKRVLTEGETYSAYLFKLTCFSSCFGGINRRPFKVVFTLEKDNVPLGRQAIEAKVCACPVRDFKLDSEKAEKLEGSYKKIKNDSTDSSNPEKVKYSIVVKDPKLYLFLKQMKTLYETSAYASKLKSDTVFPELDKGS